MAISELQIALIGAGVAGVTVVWAYNAWQERKHKQAAAKIFKSVADDPLVDATGDTSFPADIPVDEPMRREPAERIEPSLPDHESDVDGSAATASVQPAAMADVAPVVETAATAAAVTAETTEPVAHSIPPLPMEHLDPAADCIVRFISAEPVSAAAITALQEGFAGELGKPLTWFAWDASAYDWQRLMQYQGSAQHWVAALQLVDRRGPLGAGEFAAFRNGLAQVAAQIGADIELPSGEDVLTQAAQLDQFCAGVDVQFSLQVVEAGGGAFSGTKLRGVAEAAGLTLGDDGVFHYRDADGDEMFIVANLNGDPLNAETIRAQAVGGLSFTLDVPRTVRGMPAFDRMLAIAQQLARGLGGVLVDAQRQPLGESMIKSIRAKIGELQKRMEESGLPPGAPLALRLFA